MSKNELAFHIGMSLSNISMNLDDRTLAKVQPHIEKIESCVLELLWKAEDKEIEDDR